MGDVHSDPSPSFTSHRMSKTRVQMIKQRDAGFREGLVDSITESA